MLTTKKRCRPGVWLFLMSAAIWAAGCAPPGPRALLDGKRLLEQGKYPQAVERLKVATSLMATNAQAWNYLGLAYHHDGQPASAAEAYDKALRLDRDLVTVHYNLGCLLLEQNRLDAAKNELMAFNLQQRNSQEGYLKLGSVQLRLRDFGGAERTFDDARKLNPHSAEILNDLGIVQLERNHPRDAAAFFNEALKEQADYGPALLNLAVVSHEYLNNRSLALQKYEEYLALTPRPANWEQVSTVAAQLEQELNPVARPAPANGPAPNFISSNPVRNVSPATNSNLPPRSEAVVVVAPRQPAPAAPPAKVAVTSAPPAQPKVVQVQDQPTVKVADAVTTTSKPPTVTATAPKPAATNIQPVVASQTADLGVADKPEKKGMLQRLNPLNLFHHDPKPVATPTPIPPMTYVPDETTKVASVSTNSRSASNSASARSKPSAPARYVYVSPAKPAVGDRARAEQLFAEAVQAQRDRRLKDAETLYRYAVQADPGFFEAQCNLGLAAYDQGDMPQSLQAYEYALAINPGSFNARFNFALALKRAGYIQDAAVELERLVAAPGNESAGHLAMAHLTAANLYAEQFHQIAPARVHYAKVLELDPDNSQATAIRYWLRDHH